MSFGGGEGTSKSITETNEDNLCSNGTKSGEIVVIFMTIKACKLPSYRLNSVQHDIVTCSGRTGIGYVEALHSDSSEMPLVLL